MTATAETGPALAGALAARRVAIFGASATPGKMGYILVEHLLAQGFAGEVVLVNPRGGSAFGLPLQDATAAAGADLAVVVTPAIAAADIVEVCGALGIGVAIVEAAGFGEVGEGGLERALAVRARAANVRLIGPNCLGLFVAPTHLNVTTLPALPHGSVSFVSQSGGLALHVARRLAALGAGFDVLLSLGNKLDLGFADALQAVVGRPETQSILLYLERLDEGDAFLEQVEQASASLPVVALVGGRTGPGREAALSHTGSLLSDWDRAAGLLGDAGAQVADNLALAVAAAVGGRRGGRRTGGRTFALVDGGGHSVLLADAVTRAGFELIPPPPALAEQLTAVTGRSGNPLDLAGAADSDPEVYGRALAAVAATDAYDAIVIGGIFGGYGQLFGAQLEQAEEAAATEIGRLAVAHGVAVVVQTTFAASPSAPLAVLREHGVACVEWPEEALAVLSTRVRRPPAAPERPVVASADPSLGALTERVLAALRDAGVQQAVGDLVARSDLPSEEGRWALKADGFAHKTRAGAILLAVPSAHLPVAYDELVRVARAAGLEARIRLAPMIPFEHELLIAFWRQGAGNEGWVAGGGGASVERRRDVAMGRLPRKESDVLRVLLRTRLGLELSLQRPDLLTQVPPFVLRLADAFRALKELGELECNPVGLSTAGPVVLDVLPAA